MPRAPACLFVAAVLALVPFAGAVRAGEFEEALKRALLDSDAVAAARLSLRAAVEEVPVAYSSKTLTTELNVTGTSAETSTNTAERNDDTGSVTLSLKKPLYDGGIAAAQLAINELAVDEARARLGMQEEAALLAAVNAYVGLVVARDRVGLEQANARRLDEYLRATTLRVELGDATPTDLAATRARQARARASLISAETGLANAEETYRSQMGEPFPAIELPPPPAGTPDTAGAAGGLALEGNHGHRLAHAAERSARRALDLLVANVRPKLDLNLTGRSTDSSNDTRDTEEVSAGVTLSMPIAPNSAVRARSRSTVASHRAAVLRLRDSARATRLAAENAFRNYRAASGVIDAYGAELDAAVLHRDGIRAEVEYGLKTVLDLLDADQDVVSAQINLLEANRARVVAAYALLAAVGGLSASSLGLDVDAAGADGPIDAPIVLRPLPVLNYED